MALNPNEHLNEIERQVATGTRNGEETEVIRLSAVFPVQAKDLWEVLTNPDHLTRWFLPVSGDLNEGGFYELEANASGTIERCQAPGLLELTWEFGETVSWLAVTLTPEAEGTRLDLQHESHPQPGFSDVYGPGAGGVGWDLAFRGLSHYLAAPGQIAGTDGYWAMSPESRAFYRQVSNAWGQAAIAAGEAEDVAMAAAEATRAFYSGEGASSEPAGEDPQ